MLTLSTLAPAEARPRPARTFLLEVQALRALAVLLVVLYHLWPNRLTGGYVGVDVFFVISGFLITSHLHRELLTGGRIALGRFYARRARRLLPAALLVLLVTAVGTAVFLPVTRWSAAVGDLLASTFYVQNWQLAGRAVEYSASNDAASAFQHFWSLSVEEQFYLGWPALIIGLVALARCRGWSVDRLLVPGIAVVTAASFAYSVHATATNPGAAYFVTPTRIWELGAGALLALWVRGAGRGVERRPPTGPFAVALRWGGLAAIAVAAAALSSGSAFPGYLALLPVLGTVGVILAGAAGPRDPLSRPIAFRPTQYLGDISYSLYLWHWPVIVIAPFALGHELRFVEKVAILALAIGLAGLTKMLVEDTTQRWRPLARPALAAVVTVAAMLAMSGVAGLLQHELGQREDAARAQLVAAQGDPCFGAAALDPAAGPCQEPFRTPASLVLTPGDEPWFIDPACTVVEEPLRVATCRYGTEPPLRRVALVGDSHAEHWRGALHVIAQELNWEIVELLKGGCPASHAETVAIEGRPIDGAACSGWVGEVDEVLARGGFDLVFTSSFTGAYAFADDAEDSPEAAARSFADAWTGWADTGAQVFVLRDVPSTGGRHGVECLIGHPGDAVACARPRAGAVLPDPATQAVEDLDSDEVRLLDLTDSFCDEVLCYSAVGGAVVYWDADHMSGQYSRSLAPYVLDAMGGVGA